MCYSLSLTLSSYCYFKPTKSNIPSLMKISLLILCIIDFLHKLRRSVMNFNNISIRFISICILVFIINLLLNTQLFGALSWYDYAIGWEAPWFYPLNFFVLANPLQLMQFSAHYFAYSPIFLTHGTFFDWLPGSLEYGDFDFIVRIIFGLVLTAVGLGLNFYLAKLGLKETNESESDDIIDPSILNIREIFNNSIKTGFNHAGTIIGSSILWILTIWVPYINVGTTIGLLGMIPTLASNEKFSPSDIFDKKYRKNIGEYFLLVSLMSIGISIGFLFIGFPGIVIAIAWSQAIFLHIDKGFSPLKAINVSNDITYGEKMKMFFSFLLLVLFFGIIMGIIMVILTELEFYIVIGIFAFAGQLSISLILIGYFIYIYCQISKKLSN